MVNTTRTIIHVISCFIVFILSACGGGIQRQEIVPAEIVFDTSLDKIAGGLRLAPRDTQWDGYGEAVDV